mgnify:CR=1 FL=1
MTLPLLLDVDPVAVAIAHLTGHEYVVATLGAGAERVSGVNEPPYPRLVITDPPGGDPREMTWLIAPLIQIEAFGDLDGHPGKWALRRAAWAATLALTELPTLPSVPGQPVVTKVEGRTGGGWLPLATGQPRYVTTVQMYLHPARPA